MSRKKIKKKNRRLKDAIAGFAWYRREQWQRLREVSYDGDELEDTYDKWVVNAEEAFKKHANLGLEIEKVDVDVEELLDWCRAEGIEIDGDARARFAAMKLKQLHEN